jgi:hypothetical protein
LGPPDAEVTAVGAALLHPRGRELDLERDRGVVDGDAVAVEVIAEADRGREDDDPRRADEAREPARGLRVLDRRVLLQRAHGLHVRRAGVIVTRLPVLADEVSEAVEKLGHACDVVLVRVGADDRREEVVAPSQQAGLDERIDEGGKLPPAADIDDERAPSPVVLGRQDDELRVAVADVQQEVDEVVCGDVVKEVSGLKLIGGNWAWSSHPFSSVVDERREPRGFVGLECRRNRAVERHFRRFAGGLREVVNRWLDPPLGIDHGFEPRLGLVRLNRTGSRGEDVPDAKPSFCELPGTPVLGQEALERLPVGSEQHGVGIEPKPTLLVHPGPVRDGQPDHVSLDLVHDDV